MTLSKPNGFNSPLNPQMLFDDASWRISLPENATICAQDQLTLNLPSFASDPYFCSAAINEAVLKNEPAATGLFTRLWKAFELTIGIGSLDGGSAKEQWRAEAERLVPREESKIESSLIDLKRALIKLEQTQQALAENGVETSASNHSFVEPIKLLWERQWTLSRLCDLNEEALKPKQ